MSDNTEPMPALYTIKCRDCGKAYWYQGRNAHPTGSQYPKTEARYAGWLVGLRSYCPEHAKERGLK